MISLMSSSEGRAPAHLNGLRRALEAERAEVEGRIAVLSSDVDRIVAAREQSNVDDEHDPEGATIAFERSQADALLQQARRHLADVDAALGRLDAGTHGRCEVCGELIPAERLAVRPRATRCVGCAR